MATRSRARLTPEQRDERRRQQLDQLREATSALLTSEGWQRWLRTRSRFHRYSLRNTLLIAFQCPHATHVAGFRKWLELGRCVRKGEQAIRILAPVTVKQRDTDGAETGETKTFFRTVPVFDISMTDPVPGREPVPLSPPSQPITGDSHGQLIAPLIAHARRLGYSVEMRELPENGPGGWCDPKRKQIVIATGPANQQVRTLVHELAHAHGLGYDLGRERCEVLVDCVTYIVCSSVALDVGGESIPYIAGWGEDGELDAIRQYAATIDAIARTIEEALQPAAGTSATPADPLAA